MGEQLPEAPVLRVEMVLDLICAASYLAWVRLERVLSELRAQGVRAELVFRPFRLAPDAGFDGEPLLRVLVDKFGKGVIAETAQAARDALDDGVILHYDRAVTADTFEAHRLVAVAARQGLAEPMVSRLFRAHFADGLNIADRAVLDALAAETGVTQTGGAEGELRSELDRTRARGIRSVPVVLVARGPSLAGVQTETRYRAVLDAAAHRRS